MVARALPGKPGAPSVLTRLYPPANRYAIRQACIRNFGSNYQVRGSDPKGYQCDEYPFASSEEHGSGSNPAFSVMQVPSLENQLQGSHLGSWYNRDRIIGGDKYRIVVVQGGAAITPTK